MSKLDETKKKRAQFLKHLHEVTEGSSRNIVNMFELGSELGFEKAETTNIVQYLNGEHLVEHKALGGGIVITHLGVKEVEAAQSHPETSTAYSPHVNIIQVHHMEGSQIKQGTISSSQSATLGSQKDKVTKYVDKIKNHPLISLLILFGIIVISLANFTDAVNKLSDPFKSFHNKTATKNNDESSQRNHANNVNEAINVDRSNNVTINHMQNVKIEEKDNVANRLKEALRSLDAIESYLYYSIDPEPDKYQSLLSRARIEIKYVHKIKSRANNLIMTTYDCYHETGETWREKSPSALLSKGETSMYDDAMKQFQSATLPKLTLKWKECSDRLKSAHEYFEMESE